MSTSKAFTGEDAERDVVVRTAIEVAEAAAKFEAFEAASGQGHAASRRRSRDAAMVAEDLMFDLRQELTEHKAQTIAGAAIQVCELTHRFHRIWEHVPASQRTTVLEEERLAFERLAFSVLELLSTMSGQKPDDLVFTGYSDQHLNPWRRDNPWDPKAPTSAA
ncbi:hypothetical protein ACLE20_04795 [Rhizobium sp. YIM 134829]|uniref:hypothetical protein n=1 Tax=Rhizobium sp. YIM 134829 TaxID=3390453 RepID=UPI00397C99CE